MINLNTVESRRIISGEHTKACISFLSAVAVLRSAVEPLPSIRTHETTPEPLRGYSLYLISSNCRKICHSVSVLLASAAKVDLRYLPSSPTTFGFMNQSTLNLVCTSWQLNPYQQHTSQIPSINLFVCMFFLSLLCKGSVKYPPFITRQRLAKHVSATTNTRNNRIIGGHFCL